MKWFNVCGSFHRTIPDHARQVRRGISRLGTVILLVIGIVFFLGCKGEDDLTGAPGIDALTPQDSAESSSHDNTESVFDQRLVGKWTVVSETVNDMEVFPGEYSATTHGNTRIMYFLCNGDFACSGADFFTWDLNTLLKPVGQATTRNGILTLPMTEYMEYSNISNEMQYSFSDFIFFDEDEAAFVDDARYHNHFPDDKLTLRYRRGSDGTSKKTAEITLVLVKTFITWGARSSISTSIFEAAINGSWQGANGDILHADPAENAFSYADPNGTTHAGERIYVYYDKYYDDGYNEYVSFYFDDFYSGLLDCIIVSLDAHTLVLAQGENELTFSRID